jgi:hypothetical protein
MRMQHQQPQHFANGGWQMLSLPWTLQAETPPQLEMGMGGVRGFIPYAAVASLEATAMAGPPDMQVAAWRYTVHCAFAPLCMCLTSSMQESKHCGHAQDST